MTAAEAAMRRTDSGRSRHVAAGGPLDMLGKLVIAAAIALVGGPAFTFYGSACMHLPMQHAGRALAAGTSAISLEPLLPSGLF